MSQARCTFSVRGLDCPSEVEALRGALGGHEGVTSLGFDLIHATMTVDYDAGKVRPDELARVVSERTGMQAILQGQQERTESAWWAGLEGWLPTACAGVALAIGLAFSWGGHALGFSTTGAGQFAFAAYAVAVLAGGIGLFPRAVRNLRQLRFDIDVLMGLAILGALALGQWEEAATVAFLYGVSESLEAASLERARRSIRALLDLAPPTAERIAPGGKVESVPASAIARGDRVLVRAGDTIPVDGTIVEGRSSVDEKTITGESVPVLRDEGDAVYAGTVNGDGTLELVASGPVGDAVISRVVAHVREAQSGRAPIERRITRFATVYTPLVMCLSVLVMVVPPLLAMASGGQSAAGWAVWRDWIGRGLVILVIACPCPLVIATPVAVVCGLAAAARRGVLIRGGEFLEEIGRLRALAFDKTGTLTTGLPDVVEVVCCARPGG